MKRAAFAIFGVPLACAVLAWSAATAQTSKPKAVSYQHVIACAPDDCAAEVKKANEAGAVVTMASDCMAVGEKMVCVVGAEEEESEGEGR